MLLLHFDVQGQCGRRHLASIVFPDLLNAELQDSYGVSTPDNANAQGQFNNEVQEGVDTSNQLVDTIKNLAAAYLTVQSLGKAIEISDELVQTRIKLIYDNEDTGQRDVYIAQDSNNMNAWGVLQYYDTLQKGENGQAKVDALLSLYNKKTRKLTIKGAIGDTRVRAGSMVVVIMDLGDVKLQNLMLVETCKHTFKLDEHTMELKLRGGEFIA